MRHITRFDMNCLERKMRPAATPEGGAVDTLAADRSASRGSLSPVENDLTALG